MKLAPGVKIAMGSRTYKGDIPDGELKKLKLKDEQIKKLKFVEPKVDKK